MIIGGAWLDFFTKKEVEQLRPRRPQVKSRPPLYITPDDEECPRDLSLRLGAIRETFEESGILLLEKGGTLIQDKDLPVVSGLLFLSVR